jgi:hypothetical protein
VGVSTAHRNLSWRCRARPRLIPDVNAGTPSRLGAAPSGCTDGPDGGDGMSTKQTLGDQQQDAERSARADDTRPMPVVQHASGGCSTKFGTPLALAPPPGYRCVPVQQSGSRRERVLRSEIEEAIRRSGGSDAIAQVFPALKAMAREKWGCLVGVVEEGIQYCDASGTDQDAVLHIRKDAIADRLVRRRAKAR